MALDVWFDIRLVLKRVATHQTLETLVEAEVQAVHVWLNLDSGCVVRQVFVGVALQVDVVEAVIPKGTHLELLLLRLDDGDADGGQGPGAGVGRAAVPVVAGVPGPGGGQLAVKRLLRGLDAPPGGPGRAEQVRHG